LSCPECRRPGHGADRFPSACVLYQCPVCQVETASLNRHYLFSPACGSFDQRVVLDKTPEPIDAVFSRLRSNPKADPRVHVLETTDPTALTATVVVSSLPYQHFFLFGFVLLRFTYRAVAQRLRVAGAKINALVAVDVLREDDTVAETVQLETRCTDSHLTILDRAWVLTAPCGGRRVRFRMFFADPSPGMTECGLRVANHLATEHTRFLVGLDYKGCPRGGEPAVIGRDVAYQANLLVNECTKQQFAAVVVYTGELGSPVAVVCPLCRRKYGSLDTFALWCGGGAKYVKNWAAARRLDRLSPRPLGPALEEWYTHERARAANPTPGPGTQVTLYRVNMADFALLVYYCWRMARLREGYRLCAVPDQDRPGSYLLFYWDNPQRPGWETDPTPHCQPLTPRELPGVRSCTVSAEKYEQACCLAQELLPAAAQPRPVQQPAEVPCLDRRVEPQETAVYRWAESVTLLPPLEAPQPPAQAVFGSVALSMSLTSGCTASIVRPLAPVPRRP
jgi:hypothetical protein